MSEITISTGEIINIDLSAVKFGEWRTYFKAAGTSKQDDAFIEKITGLTPKQQEDMLRDDYRRIIRAIISEGNKPITDPN